MVMGNNGTGVRFLLAHLASLPGQWLLDGSPRLRERPVGPLVAALLGLGARIEPGFPGENAGPPERWNLPLRIQGCQLDAGRVSLDSAASSQFVSALLLLGARLPLGITVQVESPPPSRPYIELTARVLEAFGMTVDVSQDWREYSVPGGSLQPADFTVEGDWSAAAFPAATVAVAGGRVEIEGVAGDSRQGDQVVLAVLEDAGCRAEFGPGGVIVSGPAVRPLRADLRDCPDLFPALAVVTAVVGGRLTGLSGLAAKESDRLTVMAGHLGDLGFRVTRTADSFSAPGGMTGVKAPREALDPAADHRVAMALAVAGAVVPGLWVADPACVEKSWPGFWQVWRQLAEPSP